MESTIDEAKYFHKLFFILNEIFTPTVDGSLSKSGKTIALDDVFTNFKRSLHTSRRMSVGLMEDLGIFTPFLIDIKLADSDQRSFLANWRKLCDKRWKNLLNSRREFEGWELCCFTPASESAPPNVMLCDRTEWREKICLCVGLLAVPSRSYKHHRRSEFIDRFFFGFCVYECVGGESGRFIKTNTRWNRKRSLRPANGCLSSLINIQGR